MSADLEDDSENSVASEPRSRRMGIAGPPASFRLSSSTTGTSDRLSWLSVSPAPPSPAPSSPTQSSPPIPPRSPLRPTARRASASSVTVLPADPSPEPDHPDMSLLHARSFGSFSGLLDSQPSASRIQRPPTPSKPLPITPDPSTSQASTDEGPHEAPRAPSPSSSPSLLQAPATVTKRTHALLELLSSERAYASDLALIRDIHIPLALGQPAPFQASPVTPPASSGSSSRTVSTASESSNGSTGAGAPPMTREDARMIFNNVAEIAVFSDTFTEQLEEALGGALDGGSGQDHVGALFLETIPTLEPLYRSYITKHPSALEHLSDLPKSPALTAYLAHTQTLAASLSHAWDLPSLLIKPVQRLLKYSLLLGAVIDETPDAHPDKANLKLAREKMEEVARGVNEGRRRRDVVKEVLTGTSSSPGKRGESKPKKKGLNLGVSASVSLGRMKSIRNGPPKEKEGAEANQEADEVKRLGEDLKRCETFIRTFAKDTVEWAASVHELMEQLRVWALSFGRVIWASQDDKSEAFDAFNHVVSRQLLPFCDELSDVIKDRLLHELSKLAGTTHSPLRLLEAMYTLEPLHYGLLNLNISKSRPPPQLMEASQSYVALRAQLFAELPRYLELLNRGIVSCILQLAQWQAAFWRGVYIRWADLWEALKVDAEMNAGAAETLRVWWGRFAENETDIARLRIARPLERRRSMPPERQPSHHRPRKVRSPSFADGWSETGSAVIVPSVLSALDPSDISSYAASSTMVQSPTSMKSRSLHSMDFGRRPLERRVSTESVRSKKSGKSTKSLKLPSQYAHTHSHSMNIVPGHDVADEFVFSTHKSLYSRTNSMPISSPMPLKKSQSQGKLLNAPDTPAAGNGASQVSQDDSDRGRPSRKPTFKRRLTDSLRPSPLPSASRHRRSPSLPADKYVDVSASPSPNKSTFTSSSTGGRRSTGSGGKIPSLYACRVVHPCEPPAGVQYRDIQFFTLREDEIYEVLQEAGHPTTHPDLPLYVDEGEDCLLLVRDTRDGDIGWALASFLVPAD